ncbi:hypothetical protein B7486_56065, partial [cyanobacterium TDX16]
MGSSCGPTSRRPERSLSSPCSPPRPCRGSARARPGRIGAGVGAMPPPAARSAHVSPSDVPADVVEPPEASTSASAGSEAFPIGNHYDKEAATNPVERRLVAGFTAALEDLLPGTAQDVLEVGCGEGHQLQKVLKTVGADRVVGLDLVDVELEGSWAGLDGVQLLWGSAYDLPFPSDSFDLVLALEMLEHVDEPDTVLAE